MKTIASILFLLTASFAFAALISDDPDKLFLSAYTAFQKAEKLEINKSTAEAIQSYHEAEKFVKLLRQTHPEWNKPIVDHRARRIADAVKRLVPPSEAKKLEWPPRNPLLEQNSLGGHEVALSPAGRRSRRSSFV